MIKQNGIAGNVIYSLLMLFAIVVATSDSSLGLCGLLILLVGLPLGAAWFMRGMSKGRTIRNKSENQER